MPISHEDGQFALDCWADPEREDVDAHTDYCDNVEELRAHAMKILRAGRYRYLELSRWNAAEQDWDPLEVFTAEDLE